MISIFASPILSNITADGKMQYIYDETGKRYLDFFAGIVTVSVGHSHPYVNEKAIQQIKRIQHTTTIYLHPNLGDFAKKLAATFPQDTGLKGKLYSSLWPTFSKSSTLLTLVLKRTIWL